MQTLWSKIKDFGVTLKAIAWLGIDTVIPPVCLGCNERLNGHASLFLPKKSFFVRGTRQSPHQVLYKGVHGGHHGLCYQCFHATRFCGDSVCQRCGMGISEGVDYLTCMQCLDTSPNFDKARSVWLYDGVARDIVLRFKHGDATHFAPYLLPYMVPVVDKMIHGNDGVVYDCIIPVPLHRLRLLMRHYNQSGLLAVLLARYYDIPCYGNHLQRIKNTKNQGLFNRAERLKNVRNAFAYAPDRIARYRGQGVSLKGKSILLVDDVFTTGATVDACAKVLKKQGAKTVDVITLCRSKGRIKKISK